MNVPIPNGSLLDLTTVFKDKAPEVEEVNNLMLEAQKEMPYLIQVATDPIVSSDVIGNRHSVVYDSLAAMKTPGRLAVTSNAVVPLY